MGDRQHHPALGRRTRITVTVLLTVLAWAAVAVPVSALVFVKSSRATSLASHEALVRPTLDGWAQFELGPFLPGVRYPTGSFVGADIVLGKTSLTSYDALVRRYAFLASQPQGQIAKVRDEVREMAIGALLAGAVAGAALPGLWFLLGHRRRAELLRDMRSTAFTATAAGLTLVTVTLLATHPWDRSTDQLDGSNWQPVTTALPGVDVPAEARPLEVDGGLLTQGTKRLVASALDSYKVSSSFYRQAAAAAPGLATKLHQPAEGDTVGLLVSDRHDNIGMDRVARAIYDAGQASFLMDAGDDTSTGSSWEAFSLESLQDAFRDVEDRYSVAGNHDHGGFLTAQATRLGFVAVGGSKLAGTVVDGPDHVRLMGVDDPRSSGLGNWRDEKGLTFAEVTDRLADSACAADADGERVTTLLVHDAKLGSAALERGCVDLVLAGHLHVVVGPTPVTGTNGRTGYSFTTGTTGGAAYAIAIGTKPRRDAGVTLVTYRAGRPVGLQVVSLSPLGDFTVGDYTQLPQDPPQIGPPAAAGRAPTSR